MENRRKFMKEALLLAEKAAEKGEVPVGAVIAFENKIIGRGYNKREGMQNALCHAEIEAVNEACRALGSWRLTGCEMFVTLEPCPMCTGAIINARIDKVVFGAYDDSMGCMGGLTNLTDLPSLYRPQIVGGYMEAECSLLLSDFFSKLREKQI